MSPLARVFLMAMAIGLLSGCASNTDFDPLDWLSGDWFSSKKPLPGVRKELFPEGVPGVARGVPPELMKGNQAAALQEQEQLPAARILSEEEPKAKPKPRAKARPKPKVQAAKEPESRPTRVTVQPRQQQQSQQSPWPDPPPPRRAQSQQQVQWPDPPGQSRPASGGVQWPDPPAPK